MYSKSIIAMIFVLLMLNMNAKADLVEDMTALATLMRGNAKMHKKSINQDIYKKNKYWGLISQAGLRYGLNPYLIHSVIKHESNYNPNAVSHKNAQGLMQLMPGTARLMGVKDPFDPEQNIDGGSHYLRKMLDMFDGDVYKALLAYNAGYKRVWEGKIPGESQVYAQKVIDEFQRKTGKSFID